MPQSSDSSSFAKKWFTAFITHLYVKQAGILVLLILIVMSCVFAFKATRPARIYGWETFTYDTSDTAHRRLIYHILNGGPGFGLGVRIHVSAPFPITCETPISSRPHVVPIYPTSIKSDAHSCDFSYSYFEKGSTAVIAVIGPPGAQGIPSILVGGQNIEESFPLSHDDELQ